MIGVAMVTLGDGVSVGIEARRGTMRRRRILSVTRLATVALLRRRGTRRSVAVALLRRRRARRRSVSVTAAAAAVSLAGIIGHFSLERRNTTLVLVEQDREERASFRGAGEK